MSGSTFWCPGRITDDGSGIVASRKRKLRELFAVCDAADPIPIPLYEKVSDLATSIEEKRFLEVSDIEQGRPYDESNLPNRKLRSDTAKNRSPIRKVSPDAKQTELTRKAAKIQRDGSKPGKSRASTPSSRSDAGRLVGDVNGAQGLSMQRSTSKGSQTDLPAETIDNTMETASKISQDAAQLDSTARGESTPAAELQQARLREVMSRPNSPGVDPRKAMPILAEDAANMDGPIIAGLGSHDGPRHKALTAHLPPRDVQERHLKEAAAGRHHPSLTLPPRNTGDAGDPVSSPGTTNHSATTPAVHASSADTSPESAARFEGDRDDDPVSPMESSRAMQDAADKSLQDRVLQAQSEISRNEILRSSPVAVENQLRAEVQAAFERRAEVEDSQDELDSSQEQTTSLTKEAGKVVQDVVEDQPENQKEQDVAMNDVEESSAETEKIICKQNKTVDSEPEPSTVDHMDIDQPVINDSFESQTSENHNATSSGMTVSPTTSNPTKFPNQIPLTKEVLYPSTATSQRTPSTPAPREGMSTRVSTGAMRHKSVSEILGQIPTQSSDRSQATSTEPESARTSHSASRSNTPQSPGGRMRSLAEKARDKERSKLSTVVFAKQPSRQNGASPKSKEEPEEAKEDYFHPLFLATATRTGPSLESLMSTARKTISTADAFVPITDAQSTKVLKRIYHLQSHGSWLLRQPKRSVEPQRPETHWDVLLQEAKWLRVDFREERKWKVACARNMAYACAEWFESSPEERKLLQVNAKIPPEEPKDVEMSENSSQIQPTPELVSSADLDSVDEDDDETRFDLEETVAPTAIFGLQDDDVVFGLRNSPATDKLLNELPMFGDPLHVPAFATAKQKVDPDRSWKKAALPLSKFVEGRIELKTHQVLAKRSRYQYEEESDDDENETVFGQPRSNKLIIPPESTTVALFNPENKHIRDRIHAGHQFRPPSEFPMPLQQFFEARNASQWTWQEDDTLKQHVRDLSYNWSLISNLLTSKSMFASSAERRTPWECFERWIALEGLPTDMQKTAYFKAYQGRIDTANKNVLAQAAQAPQQANAQGQVQPSRRRATTSVRVEKRRNQRHLTLVDAMRKLAKKRENTAQKQAQAAGQAQMRKQAEQPPAQRQNMKTPQEFSRIKHEQTERQAESYRLLRQQQAHQQHQQKVALMARMNQGGQPGGVPGSSGPLGPPGLPRPPPSNGAVPNLPNGAPVTNAQNQNLAAQNRPRPPMAPPMGINGQMPNGYRMPLMNGIPQAPMQSMQPPMGLPNVDANLVTQANILANSQRQRISSMQQNGQLQPPGLPHNSPPRNLNGMSPPGFPQMQNGGMAAFPNANMNGNVSSPGAGPSPQAQGASPRINHHQHLSNGQMPQIFQIQELLRQQYPTYTNEQITRMANDRVQKNSLQRPNNAIAQSAMDAAAGANMSRLQAGVDPAHMGTPQMYAQTLRQQQEQQFKGNAAGQPQPQGQGHHRTPSANSASGAK